MRNIFIWLVIKAVSAYNSTCPHPGQWNQTAEAKNCSSTNYICLSDDIELKNAEDCRPGPRRERKGYKTELNEGNFNRKVCSAKHFQPFKFSSFKNSECVFVKSRCSDVGQISADTGTSVRDRSCRCDYLKGYAFLGNTSNLCSCTPSEEDCTCFKKPCNSAEILSPDYKCIKETELQGIHQCPSISDRESLTPVTDVVPVVVFGYDKVYIYFAATCCTIILVIIIVLSVLVVCCWKQTKTQIWHVWTYLRNCFLKIIIIKQLEDQSCDKGCSVTLACEVNHKNIPARWRKDGQEIKPSKSISITAVSKIHILVIHSVTAHDSGKYAFHILDKSSSAQLTVEEVRIIKGLEDHNCFEFDSVTFTCEVNHKNVPVRWSKDGQELEPSESISITTVGKIHILVIHSVTANDSGNYSCQIKDEISSAQLTVEEVRIIKELEDHNCIEDGPVTFTCEVNQENIPARWSRDKKELKSSESISITVVGRIHKLVIHSVTANDSGNYSCQIKDKNSSLNLIVKEVIIFKQLEAQSCFEGDSVTFTCEVDHENIPARWTKDGVELEPSETISITSDGRIHKLGLDSVTANDNGNYSCQIKTKNSSAQLTVKEVIIIKPIEDQRCIEGDSVTFTCEVNQKDSPSKSLKWRKNGQELKPTESIIITSVGRTHTLLIQNIKVNDRGYYSFKVKDQASGGHLLIEEKNYIRLCHLLKAVAEPVVRKIFDREIHPNKLKMILIRKKKIIDRLKNQKHINWREYDMLFPAAVFEYSIKFRIRNYDYKKIHQNEEEDKKLRAEIRCAVSELCFSVHGNCKVEVVELESGSLIAVLKLTASEFSEELLMGTIKSAVVKGKVGSFDTDSSGFQFKRLRNVPVSFTSKDFDIRLMMILMKNLIDFNITNILPYETDRTEVADLSRIKYIRNKSVQNSDRCLSDEEFKEDWSHLSQAVIRLGGNTLEKELTDLKNYMPTSKQCQDYLNPDNLLSDQESTSTESLNEGLFKDTIIQNLARDVIRRRFDKQFPPQNLIEEIEKLRDPLKKLKDQHGITQSQWEDLFPVDKGSLSSTRFDIKMMIILLSNTSVKDKEIFKTIETLQNYLTRPKDENKAIMQAIKEISEEE